jgi:4-diphosphocytidyl-2-C-methyl-D-erythritol kinase
MNWIIPPETTYTGQISPDKNSISISSPAKINLFLKVLRKRPDGYHDIFSWFQMLDLVDHLDIQKLSSNEIEITTNCPKLPTGEENLIHKAARLIQSEFNYEKGFRIKLWKNIPVGAGLGGGSSNAAAFIKGVNKLLDLGLSSPEMARLGLKVGSDVPFFFSRGQAEVTGRGDVVSPINLPIDYAVLLVTPPFEIRAAEAYRKCSLDLTDYTVNINFNCCRHADKLFAVIEKLDNDLSRALLKSYPILDKVRDVLTKSGADIVRISGSGPTVFALYKNKTFTAGDLAPRLIKEGWGVCMAHPIILPA